MTRKDYILIAEALRNVYNAYPASTERGAIDSAASEIAYSLEQDNSRFNREHFLAVVRGEKDLHSRPSRNGRQS